MLRGGYLQFDRNRLLCASYEFLDKFFVRYFKRCNPPNIKFEVVIAVVGDNNATPICKPINEE